MTRKKLPHERVPRGARRPLEKIQVPTLAELDLSDRRVVAAYLGGLLDGEGTVVKRKGSNTKGSHKVEIVANTDMDIIEAAMVCLDALGIRYTVQTKPHKDRPNWNTCFHVCVHARDELLKIATMIPILAKKKQDKLRSVLATFPVRKKPPEEVLRADYATMSLAEIGRKYGVTPAAVYSWMSGYNIERRSVSAAVTRDWKRRRSHAVR
jgi:LAGLIDADG-like domain